jgi:hypothetical protein
MGEPEEEKEQHHTVRAAKSNENEFHLNYFIFYFIF